MCGQVSEDELQQYEAMAQRNMHSSLFVPLDEQLKAEELAAVNPSPVLKDEMRLPKVHRRDRGNPDRTQPQASLPSYEEWARLREQRGKSPRRHRLRIRDQLDRDDTIQEVCVCVCGVCVSSVCV